MRPGLERTRLLLDYMANPERAYPILHITGSNGKTSTSRIAASIVSAHGLAVGSFTSPHLERIEERLGVNGHHATPEAFAEAVADIAPYADLLEQRTGDRPTYFELTAAMAFAWFAEKAVDLAVVEVGLGGRLDATNAADATIAVITGISKEHQKVLGSTIAEIAREKLGIVKPDSLLVTGPLPDEAEAEAQRTTDALGVQRWKYDRDFHISEASPAVGGWMVDVDGVYDTYEDLMLPLYGRYQTRNLAVAIAAIEALFGRPLDHDALREGVAAASSPGRLEVVGRRPLSIVDGSHNEEGMGVLAAALTEEFPLLSWTVVFGVLGDKDLGGMFGHLRGIADRLVVTAPMSSRAVDPTMLADVAREQLGPDIEIHVVDGVEAAVEYALRMTGPDEALITTGSLYLAGEARPILRDVNARERKTTWNAHS
jgi:dihydrofolate synthase/folylpolyglutamate synthase